MKVKELVWELLDTDQEAEVNIRIPGDDTQYFSPENIESIGDGTEVVIS